MEEFWKIYKLKFATSVFNLEKMQPGTATHYDIEANGIIKIYEVPYGTRKRQKVQKIKISEDKVKTFFDEASALIQNAKYPLLMIDDCARDWTISFENHDMKMDGDLETEDKRNLESLFWNFIDSVE